MGGSPSKTEKEFPYIGKYITVKEYTALTEMNIPVNKQTVVNDMPFEETTFHLCRVIIKIPIGSKIHRHLPLLCASLDKSSDFEVYKFMNNYATFYDFVNKKKSQIPELAKIGDLEIEILSDTSETIV